MVKSGYSITYVSNVEYTLSFHENVFSTERRFITDENDYGELNTGDTVLRSCWSGSGVTERLSKFQI